MNFPKCEVHKYNMGTKKLEPEFVGKLIGVTSSGDGDGGIDSVCIVQKPDGFLGEYYTCCVRMLDDGGSVALPVEGKVR